LIIFNNGYWAKRNNPTLKVLKKLNGYYNKDESIVNFAIGFSSRQGGIFYDEGHSRMYYNDATNYCSARGMRLPYGSETTAVNSSGGSNGVPSFRGWTLMEGTKEGRITAYYGSTGSSKEGNYFYVRCVK